MWTAARLEPQLREAPFRERSELYNRMVLEFATNQKSPFAIPPGIPTMTQFRRPDIRHAKTEPTTTTPPCL